MILNYIWIGFFIIGFLVAAFRVIGYIFRDFLFEHLNMIFTIADRDVFTAIVQSTFDMAKTSVEISIYLIGVMTLWLGIMKIGEKGGAVAALSRVMNPFFSRIFPGIPKNHPAMGSIMMNFSANMLGLDNAATPLGLKAMNELQEINSDPKKASDAMIMFLVLNTSSLTLIPISILAMRMAAGAKMPTDVFVPMILATYFSTTAGLLYVAIRQKINLLNKVVLGYIGAITLIIGGLILYLTNLPETQVSSRTGFAGNFLLFLVIIIFLVLGIRKKLNLYETFIEGAKEGFQVAIKIIPYLVAMLVAIGVFRASGSFDFLMNGVASFFALFGMDTRFVDALPVAFMKPLSGGAARGLMVETMNTFGPDSFAGRLACIVQGSTETTFYTVAVYYGAVNIRNTRYTVTGGLFADLAGVIASIFIAYIFFGSA
ncbi:MAG TPA: nucleoside recognition domain-containing protein [Bacteroidales bacterium]|jgi:spore maturation protein SpmA|nr:nucleoside recognition domain-containing protein [Bacteroidales bacterium]